jgi:hypothetical protein
MNLNYRPFKMVCASRFKLSAEPTLNAFAKMLQKRICNAIPNSNAKNIKKRIVPNKKLV